jgi:hypothetical protein
VKRQLSTSTWQTQANKTHFQEHLDKYDNLNVDFSSTLFYYIINFRNFKNNDSTLVNNPRGLKIDESLNFLSFSNSTLSALSNSGKNTALLFKWC